MELKEYEQRKFALAEIVRTAQAANTNDGWLFSEATALLARLAEDRFNLMVVGRFSRGKSTLLNTLLGDDYLPTGIVPLTSVITTVRYGSRKQVVLNFANSRLTSEVPLSRLAEFVTETSNPGNVKRVAYAEIQLRVELLRRGLFFVDSPGIGSPIIENTLTTERFLPQADAFVLVTSYDSPLSEEEDRILRRIEATNKKIYILINKQDTVSEEEREQVWEFVTTRLSSYAFQEKPQIFSISARQGLAAAQAQDARGMQESGIVAFEQALLSFLTQDRAEQFLRNMYERIRSFLVQTLGMPEQSEHAEAFEHLLVRLTELRQKVLGADTTELAPVGAIPANARPLAIARRSGCRVCGAILEEVSQFLASYQFELTISADARADHARRGGFCPLHTWQYEAIASPQGVCVSYPPLAHRMATQIHELGEQQLLGEGLTDALRKLPANAKTCRVCEVRLAAESAAVREIAGNTAGEDARFPACCLPHLIQVVEALGPGAASRSLLRSHASLLERTAEDLERFALKHYALRRGLASEEERSAAKLALVLLVGHRDASAPKIAEGFI
jgi:GTPase Era involved in 16S rRNA processing